LAMTDLGSLSRKPRRSAETATFTPSRPDFPVPWSLGRPGRSWGNRMTRPVASQRCWRN